MSVLRDEFRDPGKVIAIEHQIFSRSHNQTIDFQKFEPAGNSALARELSQGWIKHGSG
jgi:hypothetical protein